jgi:hypothetical protein
MGDDAEIRRKWIESFVSFTLEEKYHLEEI